MDMPVVQFDTTHGAIVIELNAEKAPVTVQTSLIMSKAVIMTARFFIV